MSDRLKGKVAVVTGASKGIGAAIAKKLAAEGAAIVVNYASSKEGGDRVVADITKAGGKAIAVGGSVGKPEEIDNLFAQGQKAYGKVDVLVNNAGVYTFAPIEGVTSEGIAELYNINVAGLLLAGKAAVHSSPRRVAALSILARWLLNRRQRCLRYTAAAKARLIR